MSCNNGYQLKSGEKVSGDFVFGQGAHDAGETRAAADGRLGTELGQDLRAVLVDIEVTSRLGLQQPRPDHVVPRLHPARRLGRTDEGLGRRQVLGHLLLQDLVKVLGFVQFAIRPVQRRRRLNIVVVVLKSSYQWQVFSAIYRAPTKQ